MATQLEQDEPLELDEDMALAEASEGEEAEQGADAEGEDEELVPTFGDEPATEAEPTDLVKHLRKQLRERDKELAQTRKAPQAEQPIEVGSRPTIEACDYDQEKFDTEFDAWEARKEAKRQQDQRTEQQQRQQSQAWEQVQTNYATKKAALPYPDKEKVEAAAFEALTPIQQAVIAKVAPDPALLIYAIGKNQAKLDQLAAIDDPLVLAATIGRMGATLQVKKRTQAPDPDTPVRGGTVRSGSIAKQLEKLEAAAEKTHDRTAIARFKKQNGLA